jgi:hypothetical protein|tara:strand:+ start:83 stop:394 length:312 start_codon:yes stop_codon:yes gene_type:complete
MVDFEEDTVNQTCVCKLSKLKEQLVIRKARDGFIFFEVTSAKGKVAYELSGRYSSIITAKKAVQAYENNIAVSPTLKREQFAQDRIKRKEKKNNVPVFEPEGN